MYTKAAVIILSLLFYLLLGVTANFLSLTPVVALGANVICNKIPGLAPRQRTICQSRPDAIVAVGEGAKLGQHECQHQFMDRRWNCTDMGPTSKYLFGSHRIGGTREAAYKYAISSAGVAYAITQACSRGDMSSCGCDQGKIEGMISEEGWQWGGCSADINYGLKFAKIFVDAREIQDSSLSLMNLHNNRVGRKIFKDSSHTNCKCHGVSGACTMKTCWVTLPGFREVGTKLMKKYSRAKQVVPISGQRARKPAFIKLKRSTRDNKKPRRRDLVFLQDSPNFCDYDREFGALGTVGRRCNKTARGIDSCDTMCCGRGYNTNVYNRATQCNCKFHWCCHVTCDTCRERTQEHTCK